MSATERHDPRALETDAQALHALQQVLSDVLDRISFKLYTEDDTPSVEAVESAARFTAHARAIVRAFEEGPQGFRDEGSDRQLFVFAPEGEPWLVGARAWQAELENHAVALTLEQPDLSKWAANAS